MPRLVLDKRFRPEREADQMLLTIDIGNTLINFALWDEEELTVAYKANTKPLRSEDEYRSVVEIFLKSKNVDAKKVDRAVISSVVPSVGTLFRRIVNDLFHLKAKIVGPKLKTGLPIKTDNPAEVGADLVCDAVGAKTLFGNDLFIVDLGTANKFLYVDGEGAFAGCAIAPGLAMGASTLNKDTAALPEISLLKPDHVIGKNTNDSMNSGVLYTNLYAIKGFAQAFEKEAGHPLQKILTGGNAIYVKDDLPEFSYVKDLLHIGLREIEKKNRK